SALLSGSKRAPLLVRVFCLHMSIERTTSVGSLEAASEAQWTMGSSTAPLQSLSIESARKSNASGLMVASKSLQSPSTSLYPSLSQSPVPHEGFTSGSTSTLKPLVSVWPSPPNVESPPPPASSPSGPPLPLLAEHAATKATRKSALEEGR